MGSPHHQQAEQQNTSAGLPLPTPHPGDRAQLSARQLLRGDSIHLHVAREALRNHSKPPRAKSRDVFCMLLNLEAYNSTASSGLYCELVQ